MTQQQKQELYRENNQTRDTTTPQSQVSRLPYCFLQRASMAVLILVLWSQSTYLIAMPTTLAPSAQTQSNLLFLDFAGSPPLTYRTNRGVSGALPDIIREVFAPLGYAITTRYAPGPRIYAEASAGRTDIIAVHTFPGLQLDQYPSYLSICPRPIFSFKISTFSHINSRLQINTQEDLRKVKLGLIRYAQFKRVLTQKHKLGNVARFSDSHMMFKSLVSGRVDIILSDPYSIKYLTQKNQQQELVEQPFSIGEFKAYIAISMPTQNRLGIMEAACKRVGEINQQSLFRSLVAKHSQRLLNKTKHFTHQKETDN